MIVKVYVVKKLEIAADNYLKQVIDTGRTPVAFAVQRLKLDKEGKIKEQVEGKVVATGLADWKIKDSRYDKKLLI